MALGIAVTSRNFALYFYGFFSSVLFWVWVISLVLGNQCPFANGRECNGRGTCSAFSKCKCDWYFSGESCESTQVAGYLTASNDVCFGLGNTTLSAPVPFVECQTSYSLTGGAVGGWGSAACAARVRLGRKRIYNGIGTVEDFLGTPLCLCVPPYGGENCNLMCPQNDGSICSGNGNTTVDFLVNGTTTGVGCQCASRLTLPRMLPYLTQNQLESVAQDLPTFQDGLCAELVQLPKGPITASDGVTIVQSPGTYIVVPTVPYLCYCDDKHWGPSCNFGLCGTSIPNGELCNARGHTGFGFGAELNTTKAVSSYGVPSTPICTGAGSNGCCYGDTSICALPERVCPPDRPFRCSSTSECVGFQTQSKCVWGYQYGYYDDPSQAPKRPLAASNTFGSPLVWFEFRVPLGTSNPHFNYQNKRYDPSTSSEFWSGVLKRTTAETSLDAFTYAYDLDSFAANEDLVEYYPAPFRLGDTNYDRLARVKSTNNKYVVLDVESGRAEWATEMARGVDFVANVSLDGYLRPGGSVVDADTCLSNLASCVWTSPDLVSVDGQWVLCQLNGNLWSRSSALGCGVTGVSWPLQMVRTIAVASPRSSQIDFSAKWALEEYVGPTKTWSMTVSIDGNWTGFARTVDDLRYPCVCPPLTTGNTNRSVQNYQWTNEFNRQDAVTSGQRVAALVELYGDSRYVRGVLGGNGRVVTTREGETFSVTHAKRVSAAEYLSGRPDPNDYVFPARCPGGDAASLRLVVRPASPTTTECVASAGGTITCDNGCVCAESCVCPNEPESETPLLAALPGYLTGDCFLTRGAANQTVSISKRTNTTCFRSSRFVTPEGFTIDRPVLAFTRRRFFDDAWVELSDVVEIVNSTTFVWPMDGGYLDSYNEWCVETNDTDATVTPTWGPFGVSAFDTTSFNLTASSSTSTLRNVLGWGEEFWEDDGSGSNSWIRVSFAKKVRLVGLRVVFRTAGLWVGRLGMESLPVAVEIQLGDDSSQDSVPSKGWIPVGYATSKVVNGTDVVDVFFDGPPSTTLRMISRYPGMSIRKIVPLTDQACDLGVLTPGSILPEDEVVEYLGRDYVRDGKACVGSDTCVLHGISAANDGLCSDYAYLTQGLSPWTQTLVVMDFNASQVLQATLDLNDTANATSSCLDNGCCVWGWDSPPPPTSCANVTLGSTWVSGYTETPWTGRMRRTTNTTVWGPKGILEGFNACRNGTDFTDCGCSWRPGSDAMPGFPCANDDLEKRLEARNVSLGRFASTASIANILALGSNLTFSVTYARDLTTLSRGACGDCDGEYRCPSGECVLELSQCPVAYYNAPGDGCVRVNPNTLNFACACAVGFGGPACEFSTCTDLDMKTGAGNPDQWCTCGGSANRRFPKIRLHPSVVITIKSSGYTTKEIELLNNPTSSQISGDVNWKHVQLTDAPFGRALVRLVKIGGLMRKTNCGFYKQAPDGEYYDVRGFVSKWSNTAPHQVVEWKEWTLANGSITIVPWSKPTAHDELPVRCPGSGSCVSDERECYIAKLVNPQCGGTGTCRPDGTCVCDIGYADFVLTESLTRAMSVPYTTVGGVSDPTAWTTPDQVSSYPICQARNCSEVDCSPPHGCFTGSPSLNFADRLMTCPTSSGHGGRCAIDRQACLRGDVVDPLPCRGNGVVRKVDYRNEYVCECGTSKGSLDPKETSELIPNGFGGYDCGSYYSDEPAEKIWIQRTDPVTHKAYVGTDGNTLPFKWFGPSNSHVGAKPEDATLWQTCCPGIKRLDTCSYVPCGKGSGPNKMYTCELAWNCLDSTTTPAVAVCNGHGKALMDGSCLCDTDDEGGWTYDLTIESGKGCIKRASCAKAVNGMVCNKKSNCGDFDSWSELPKIRYLEQQAQTLEVLHGQSPSNRTFVETLFPNTNDERMLYSVSEIARDSLNQRAQAASTICVYPDNNYTNPEGMMPYDPSKVCRYMDGYVAPHVDWNSTVWTPSSAFAILTDGMFGASSQDWIRLNDSMRVDFPRSVTLYAARVHARGYAVGSKIQFHGSAGFVCDDAPTASFGSFAWSDVICVPTYVNFDFRSVYPVPFAVNCRPIESSLTCTTWKDATCRSLGYKVNAPGDYTDAFVGCDGGRCCVPASTPFSPTGFVSLVAVGGVVDVDELRLFTYDRTVDPLPSGLQTEIQQRFDWNGCVDGKFFSYLLGAPLTAFKQRDWGTVVGWPEVRTNHNWTTARDSCGLYGGVLASNREGADPNDLARSLGQICFGLETDEPPPSNALSNGVGCLVAARERSEVKHPAMSIFVDARTLAWGCWTPIRENYADATYDYFSTPKTDDDGAQWKTEWSSYPGLISTARAVYEVQTEAKRQAFMTRKFDTLSGNMKGYVGGIQTPEWRRFSLDPYWGRGPWRNKYVSDPVDGDAFVRDTYAPPYTPRPTEVWTNPQVCVVTVYANPLCGRFFGNWAGQHQNDGETKAVFVATPADDYAIFSFANLIDADPSKSAFPRYAECVDGTKTSCDGLGDSVTKYAKSISIQGPCMAIVTGDDTAENGAYTYYVTDPGDHITYAHYTAYNDPFGATGNCDWWGRWVGGCWSQFNRDPPLDIGAYCTGIKCGFNPEIPDMLPPQPDATDGMPQNTITGIRIVPKFTTRKLTMTVRANPTASIAAENDFVLGADRHPYMGTNVVVKETMRLVAGQRSGPSSSSVDWTPRDGEELLPVRFQALKMEVPAYVRGYGGDGHTKGLYIGTDSNPFKSLVGGEYEDTFYPYAANAGAYAPILIDVFVPTETQASAFEFTVAELKAGTLKGSDSGLNWPWVAMRDLGRPILRCRNALLPQTKDWEWDQGFFDTNSGTFQTIVGTLSSTTTIRAPIMHASWTSTSLNDVVQSYVALDSTTEFSMPTSYARLISAAVVDDYRRTIETVNRTTAGLYHDWCMQVVSTPGNDFAFEPAVCEAKKYKSMCEADTLRYTVQPGCQCDFCGPDSRGSPLQPGATAFTLNPLAQRDGNEVVYDITDAYLSGDWVAYLDNNPPPYDEIVAFVMSRPESFISSIPGFWENFLGGVSTRPGRVSAGQVADAYAPIDFNWQSWFQVDCGLVTSPYTGVTRGRCAKSLDQCSVFTTPADTPMALADLPTSLTTPILIGQTTEPMCGRYVSPMDLVDSTEEEGPAPGVATHTIVDSTFDWVTIQVATTNGSTTTTGSYRNSKRDLGSFTNFTTLSGTVTCSSPSCVVSLSLTSLNPDYGDPTHVSILGSALGDFYFNAMVDSVVYRTLEWTYTALPGTTVRMSKVLITDATSRAECSSASRVTGTWMEPPLFADSGAPRSQCVVSDIDAMRLGVLETGQCWCDEASPYGGPTCEYPTTFTKSGKLICGQFPGVYYPTSLAVAPDGSVVDVNEFGVFSWTDAGGTKRFGCKTRTDVGSIIKSVAMGGAIGDFKYVVKSTDTLGLPTFVVPTSDEISVTEMSSSTDVPALCASLSSTLPSITTGVEFAQYLSLAAGMVSFPLVLDLKRTPTFDWVWKQRSEMVLSCVANQTSLCGADVVYKDVCVPSHTDACAAYNFNNLVYNQTNDYLTDGTNSTGAWMSTSITIPVSKTVTSGIRVTIQTNYTGTLSVSTNPGALSCVASGSTFSCGGTYADPRNNIVSVTVVGGPAFVREIKAFWVLDGFVT